MLKDDENTFAKELKLVLGISIQIPEPSDRNVNKGNNKITELRTILQRESQNS